LIPPQAVNNNNDDDDENNDDDCNVCGLLSIFIVSNLFCSFFLYLLNKIFLFLYSFDLAFLHNDGLVLVASWCVDRTSLNVSQGYGCVDCDG
jgi:hypothetical protein